MDTEQTFAAPALAAAAGESGRPGAAAIDFLRHSAALRKVLILAALAVIWQLYASWLHNPLILPSFVETALALRDGLVSGEIPTRVAVSLRVLLGGYAAGVALAAVLASLAASSRFGSDLLETLASMLNPLPAVALLPLALLWFGLGTPSITFVLVHSVAWPVALSTHAGFGAVSPTLRMVGRNYGLRGAGFIGKILVPAAFPPILTGLKVGWAFAWRTLIAAELVFGVSSGSGGLGWYIYERKNELETASVFAGLATVIIIGIAVEHLVFDLIERQTVRKWGMKR